MAEPDDFEAGVIASLAAGLEPIDGDLRQLPSPIKWPTSTLPPDYDPARDGWLYMPDTPLDLGVAHDSRIASVHDLPIWERVALQIIPEPRAPFRLVLDTLGNTDG